MAEELKLELSQEKWHRLNILGNYPLENRKSDVKNDIPNKASSFYQTSKRAGKLVFLQKGILIATVLLHGCLFRQ